MYDPKSIEAEITEKWKKMGIIERLRKFMEGGSRYYFLDGPPYATGSIHMGTGWNKILKDYYLRFFRMLGHNVWFQPGYDCHGLPIENKVEKKLGLRVKDDIEKFGIEKFIKECRNYATEFIDVMNEQFADLGVWMDWDNPYLTLDNSYIEGAWHTFKRAFEKGLLYKGEYSVHVCPHCATAVAYNEIVYFKAKDTSVFVKFPLRGKKNEYLVIWTTTPWTLPSNTGVMVHPRFDYAKVRTGSDTLIIAKELVERVMEKIGVRDYEIKGTIKGKELEGVEYDNPLKDLVDAQKDIIGRVVLSDMFVNVEEGTGLVHTAPGHGKEDYKVGRENGLPSISPLNLDGTFKKEGGKYAGMFAKDADSIIMQDLEKKGVLLGKESVTHDYPKCWRCDTPLLMMAVPQWFFRISAIRDKLIKENKKVNWVPVWAGKRFHDWLTNLDDWPISRQRYWGIPLPIWTCEKCGKTRVLGSMDELPRKLDDIHRPYIDRVKLECECGGAMSRVKDVLDVWFDSGVASWASIGYPSNKKLFKEMWPADLNLEGSDQFRGWWNSEIITSVITFDRAPYKNIVMHAMVLDVHGSKMSKSKGNVVTPNDVVEKYGRDVLRYYLLKRDPSEDFNFNWEDVKDVMKFFTIFYNCVEFFKSHRGVRRLPARLGLEDAWIVSKVNRLVEATESSNSQYHSYRSLQAVESFILNDLSRWYIKLVKGRGKDAPNVLHYVLDRCARVLAPAVPYLAEKIAQDLELRESVHLDRWPKPERRRMNRKLEEQMEVVKHVTEASSALRQENSIKLKYPLNRITISGNDDVQGAVKTLKSTIRTMANVKDVKVGGLEPRFTAKPNYSVAGKKFGSNIKKLASVLEKSDANDLKKRFERKEKQKINGFDVMRSDVVFSEKVEKGTEGREFPGGRIVLDLKIDDDLKKEWLLRELVRAVQGKRKEMGLNVADKIILYLPDEKVFKDSEKMISSATGSRTEFGDISGDTESIEFEGVEYPFGVERA